MLIPHSLPSIPLNEAFVSDCNTENTDAITLLSPELGAVVEQLNWQQKRYLFMPRDERIAYFVDPEKRLQLFSAGQYPTPVKFSWHCKNQEVKEFTFVLSETADFSRPLLSLRLKNPQVAVENFKINCLYHWQVFAQTLAGPICSRRAYFQTEDQAPRIMHVEGVPNFRDLGGRKAMDGKRVRQNLLFRSAGLNDNAKPVFYSEEEMSKLPEYAEEYALHKGRSDELKMALEYCHKWQKRLVSEPNSLKVLPPLLAPEWSVFRPDRQAFEERKQNQLLASIKEIPEKFLGVEAEKITMDSRGNFIFPEITPNAPAIFMQELDSPAEGVLQLGCGADWFWEMRVNQELIYDKIAGNCKAPVSSENFHLQIPLRKGKNLLLVLVHSGAGSWAWSCAGLPKTAAGEIFDAMIDNLQAAIDNLWQVVKGTKKGESRLTPKSREYLLEKLGVKIDLDLRREGECWGMQESPLGSSVKWLLYSLLSYAWMQGEESRTGFTKIFHLLLEESNYPLLFHCIAGQDRTGSLAFALNALLGVDIEELYLDWEASGFLNSRVDFRHELAFDKLLAGFAKWPGENWQQKVEAYVLSLGFTKKDIDKFRHLMLE